MLLFENELRTLHLLTLLGRILTKMCQKYDAIIIYLDVSKGVSILGLLSALEVWKSFCICP